MTDRKNWLIYGATGYTGELIARQAATQGDRPILAGRNAEKVAALATQLECPNRSISLDEPAKIVGALADVDTVLNCAGPFAHTAPAWIAACLAARVNYLDITGEFEVIELAAQHHEHARHAGVTLMPAVGFDVVPTDCLAAMLAERLPDAVRLELAFAMEGRVSRGTAKTMLAAVPTGGRARIAGRIEQVPSAWKSMRVPFADRPRWAMTIPWGDVSSAYYTTGIDNIEVYSAVPRATIAVLRLFRGPLKLLGWPPLARLVSRGIDRLAPGPDAAALARDRGQLWGRVTNRSGKQVTATLETPGGYALTVLTALAAVERVRGGGTAAGFLTPARAFGPQFICEFPSTSFRWAEDQPGVGGESMTAEEVASLVRRWFDQARQVIGPVLPDGWFGRPHDNAFTLKDVRVVGDTVSVILSEETALNVTRPRRVYLENSELVFDNFEHATFQWTDYDGTTHREKKFDSGQVRFAPPLGTTVTLA